MSPFDKDYKSGIDMSKVDSNNRRGASVSRHVTKMREINPMFGTLHGIGELVVEVKSMEKKLNKEKT